MLPEGPDVAHLWDLLEAAREVVCYTSDLSFHAYQQDRMRQRAVERALEIVGEAARRLSAPFKQAHDDVPWRRIIAQRNVLAHEYGEIVQERIWRVATVQVPDLIVRLEPLLPPPPSGDA